jgi:hypothetical protein
MTGDPVGVFDGLLAHRSAAERTLACVGHDSCFTVASGPVLDKDGSRSYLYRALMQHDCFADEIAIDFPSVDHVVDRMRDAFLGERADAERVSAEISLSPEDAWRGLVVSFDVPVRGLCPMCGGRGETWTEPCVGCCGTGDWPLRVPVRLAVPPRVADGARFRLRVIAPDVASVPVEVRVAIRTETHESGN